MGSTANHVFAFSEVEREPMPGRLSFVAGFLLKKSGFLPGELKQIRGILNAEAGPGEDIASIRRLNAQTVGHRTAPDTQTHSALRNCSGADHGIHHSHGVPRLFGIAIFWRITIALLLVATLGFVVGIPFPLSLRLAIQRSLLLGSWAWGVNGFFTGDRYGLGSHARHDGRIPHRSAGVLCLLRGGFHVISRLSNVKTEGEVVALDAHLDSGSPTNHPESSHPGATCCAGYNDAHAWHSALVQNSALTKSNRRWVRAAWARFIAQKMRASGAM
jgi:hypothetical protein